MTDSVEPLAVQLDRSGPRLTVYVTGDLDPATTPGFTDQVRVAIDGTVEHIELDLSEVTFCDSSGLGALLALKAHAAAVGATVHLVDPSPQLIRVVDITGLNAQLGVATAPAKRPA